jgi:hypothetical protein
MESLTLDNQDVERLLDRLDRQARLPTATPSFPLTHAEPPTRTRPPYRQARRAQSRDRHPEVQNSPPEKGASARPARIKPNQEERTSGSRLPGIRSQSGSTGHASLEQPTRSCPSCGQGQGTRLPSISGRSQCAFFLSPGAHLGRTPSGTRWPIAPACGGRSLTETLHVPGPGRREIQPKRARQAPHALPQLLLAVTNSLSQSG